MAILNTHVCIDSECMEYEDVFEKEKYCEFGAILINEFEIRMSYRLSIKIVLLDNNTGEIV